MSNEESIIEPAGGSGVPEFVYNDPVEQDGCWLEEQSEEDLPRRPRRRLRAPVPVLLLGVLLIAGGFIAGVLVEKGQNSSSTAAGVGASSLASKFAALRGRSSGAAGAGGIAAGGSAAAGFLGRATGAGATTGQVAYVSGSTLYVTTAEGNTVKVTTSPSSSVNKTVKTSVGAIHPGETVLITGSAGAKGAISAESIRVGASAGGIGALFGGSSAGSSGTAGGRSAAGGGEPALFGRGG